MGRHQFSTELPFTPNSLNNSTNHVNRFITVDIHSRFTDTIQDYWNSQDTNAETASNYATALNMLSMNSFFSTGLNLALVDVDSMARFLYTFVRRTQSFRIYLCLYTKKDDGTIVYTTYLGGTEPASKYRLEILSCLDRFTTQK